MSTRFADGSSPLLGDRHGVADPMVRVGTGAAARNLPVNEAAAAYSFAHRYPRLAKLVRAEGGMMVFAMVPPEDRKQEE